jgi:hypothetical protein
LWIIFEVSSITSYFFCSVKWNAAILIRIVSTIPRARKVNGADAPGYRETDVTAVSFWVVKLKSKWCICDVTDSGSYNKSGIIDNDVYVVTEAKVKR